jgi:hypothetical protein
MQRLSRRKGTGQQQDSAIEGVRDGETGKLRRMGIGGLGRGLGGDGEGIVQVYEGQRMASVRW